MTGAIEQPRALVRLTGGRTGLFARNVWRFEAGQQWALEGSDGETKAALCAGIAFARPLAPGVAVERDASIEGRVQIVSFAQQCANARKRGYLQSRYHSEVDEAGPGELVRDYLSFNRVYEVNPFEIGRPLRAERRSYRAWFGTCVRLLDLSALADRQVLALSNGEHRRVLLARALLADPRLLILDDPCAGLDARRREQVKRICDALANRGLSLLVNVRHADEIPSCVTHVMAIARGRIRSVRANRGEEPAPRAAETPPRSARPVQIRQRPARRTRPVVELEDVGVAYDGRTLFAHLTWTVRAGERWVLRGANGSGKTTLLSLITGDNPLAYANAVTVFGMKRGAPGAELAAVRRRIGMVSPELQAYTGASAGELLEAALAKRPDLLLLDEPCLNLDERAARQLKRRVSAWLKAHPSCAAICVAHRPEDVPSGFDSVLSLT
ncbi:MAG: ATP-binding cassette domain-containing protein [Kiritimatiellia bacterium]